ncbi:MAG: hypothetical protein L0241_00155 [Planctomycetia bacterium]|nr:hypothetical protein [Planctomycetia bacterium]
MFLRTLPLFALLMLVASAEAADTKMTVKVEDTVPPKELSEAVRDTLDKKAMDVFNEKGKLFCTVWAVKSLDSKATPEQAKAGLKYTHLEETTVVGAVKFADTWVDYRKQKIKPGVYTLRLGLQPMDGDHMGTAPYNEFCLLCPADQDKKPELLDVKELYELSGKSTARKHPALMMLFPNKTAAEAPAVEAKPKEHVVLSYRVPTKAGTEKSHLGFSLTIVGVSSAE